MAPSLGRETGADLAGQVLELALGQEELQAAMTCVDVAAMIDRNIAAIAAYRSQFALQRELILMSLALDLLASSISSVPAARWKQKSCWGSLRFGAIDAIKGAVAVPR